jgi:hypothetical protein
MSSKAMIIELTSGNCNAKCLWCFNTYDDMSKELCGMMKFDNFKEIVRLNKTLPAITPFNKGEH